ncbi:AraC family transcriptional regulator [Brucellaceae bacterium VT-16-1752]|uniref:Helix-turn-helix transcriptional regulator n=1 Tax=Ochrobactrum soli TaxID=2448455 RepID=A0A849KQC8_9HYPH|nr:MULTISPECIES: AraC family transcriptional regulator [Brucella]NNU60769.1 helix-turn-helix transcriptional regulator [[Ochrobactrum] soli]RRD25480.1 AraC family transcriptional regulator [Brucellaceae bacterium VT-16-1752]WHS30329.1 AraC family transcriptional regulator [Brucella sp. NM4]WHT45330.1 AraC family transcriptional regulator [Ochrobactrum sp. SSR]
MKWLDSIPEEWGKLHKTDKSAVTLTRTGPNQIQIVAPDPFALILLTPQIKRETRIGSDRSTTANVPVGSLELIPDQADLFARWRTPKENILSCFGSDRLRNLAGVEFETDEFELRPLSPGRIDKTALALARLMREEILRGNDSSNLLYLDSLNVALWLHLLRNHSSIRKTTYNSLAGGFSARAWRTVDDYMRSHLADTIPIETLASLARLSVSHFSRAFRQTTGKSPHQYLIDLRVERAELLIRADDLPLAEIWRICGFGSQSHMTSLIRERLHTTPTKIRRGEI